MRLFYTLLMLFAAFVLRAQPGPSASMPGESRPDTGDDFTAQPALAWKFSARQPFFASPVIDGDRVYVGNNDSTLYCLDIRSGKLVWKFVTHGPVRSGVCIDHSRLFLIGGDSGVYCLDKASGQQ